MAQLNVHNQQPSQETTDYSKGLKEAVSEYEKTVILDCLHAANWQIKRVAEQLSLPVSTLSHKMKKYDISAAGESSKLSQNA